MEILIKRGVTNYVSASFHKTNYKVYTTEKISEKSVKELIRSVDAGQDITVKIEELTAGLTSYKYMFTCELSCDSSG
jgi:hypothetical protein